MNSFTIGSFVIGSVPVNSALGSHYYRGKSPKMDSSTVSKKPKISNLTKTKKPRFKAARKPRIFFKQQ